MEKPKCGTCPYWDSFGYQDSDGECHRHPPIVNPTQTKIARFEENDGEDYDGLFPIVSAGEFCGEHPLFRTWIDALSTLSSSDMTCSRNATENE